MRKMYYAILSGLYERLSRSELAALLEIEGGTSRITGFLEGAAIIEAEELPAHSIVQRAAYVKEIGQLIGVSEATLPSILDEIKSSIDYLKGAGGPFRVEVTRYKGYSRINLPHTALKHIVTFLDGLGLPLSPRSRNILRIHVTEGVALIGIPLSRLDVKPFQQRKPRVRPFFKPGPLDPQLSRAFVNLARLRRGVDVYLDPFCGTGGFVIEACYIRPRGCICGDLDPVMAEGARVNLDYYGFRCTLVMQADAARIPLADESVDSIATDPPYGRSTTLAKRRREDLYREFLGEAARVLVKGGWLAFAAPVEAKPADLASEAGFRVVDYIEMYVHSSLTRGIVVARKE